MLETKLRDKIRSLIVPCGAVFYKVHGSKMQVAGWPDCYIASRIWTGWLELKTEKRQLEPLQRAQIKNLRFQYVPAFVLRGCTPRGAILEDEDGNEIGLVRLIDGPDLLQQLAEYTKKSHML